MARVDELLKAALASLPEKPADTATRADKKRYSEQMSEVAAAAFAEELRYRGLKEVRPASPGELDMSGAERRISGGIGAKKVDVTWASEESGLIFAMSIKSINFRDRRSGNFQKNLANRRGEMLFESVTIHRRFPYSVLAGVMLLDRDAESDATERRRSTFINAHDRLRLFTGRADPAGRDEQYERLYLILTKANPLEPTIRAYRVGFPSQEVGLSDALDDILNLIVERNPDFYEFRGGDLIPIPR